MTVCTSYVLNWLNLFYLSNNTDNYKCVSSNKNAGTFVLYYNMKGETIQIAFSVLGDWTRAARFRPVFYCVAINGGFCSDVTECRTSHQQPRFNTLVQKMWNGFFLLKYYSWWPVWGGSLGASLGKQVLGCHSGPAQHLYWHECIQTSLYHVYMKEDCSSTPNA